MAKELSAKDKKSKLRLEESLKDPNLSLIARYRRFYALFPEDPRCASCLVPFEGVGGSFFRALLNRRRSAMNPLLCNRCEENIRRLGAGAEVEMSMLFADIRGSTPLAESMTNTEFKDLIDRFYSETTHVLAHSYAVIDKLVGDEVSGYYIPGFVGKNYALKSIEAAQEMLRVTGHTKSEGPWAPIGIGINTGKAYFGAVKSRDGLVDLTALGDSVNTASRLASKAAAGEIVMSEDTVQKAGIDTKDLEKRTLELKGKRDPMDVWVMQVSQVPNIQ
jgi:adenylate cyclase